MWEGSWGTAQNAYAVRCRHDRKELGSTLVHSHRKLFLFSSAVQQQWLMPADNSYRVGIDRVFEGQRGA